MLDEQFFSSTATLVGQFERNMRMADPAGVPPLAGPVDFLRLEFRLRLRQLSALYERIELLNEYVNVTLLPDGHYSRIRWKGGIPAPFSVWMPHIEELTMWADAFYLLAWRAHEIMNESNPAPFPGVAKVSAPGIRDVRNRLIQHPEETSLVQAWAFHPDDGPMIKPAEHRPGSSAPSDRGLFVNAREFRDKLNSAFGKVVGAP